MNCKCPKCGEGFDVVASAVIPASQVMHMALTSESEFLDAKIVGEAMVHMSKLQIAVAKEMGVKIIPFLKSVEVEPHKVTIGFQIIQTKL